MAFLEGGSSTPSPAIWGCSGRAHGDGAAADGPRRRRRSARGQPRSPLTAAFRTEAAGDAIEGKFCGPDRRGGWRGCWRGESSIDRVSRARRGASPASFGSRPRPAINLRAGWRTAPPYATVRSDRDCDVDFRRGGGEAIGPSASSRCRSSRRRSSPAVNVSRRTSQSLLSASTGTDWTVAPKASVQ